jgi:hypothetical protein
MPGADEVTICRGQLGNRAVALGGVAAVPRTTKRLVGPPLAAPA